MPAYVTLTVRAVMVTVLFEALAPVMPMIADDLGVTPAGFQTLVAVALMTTALALLGAPWLVDSIRRLRTVSLSAILVCLLGLASTQARTYAVYAAILLCMYVINALGSAANRALLRDCVRHGEYRRLFAYSQAALEAASIVAPLLAAMMAAAWGWRVMFAVLCLPLLALPPLLRHSLRGTVVAGPVPAPGLPTITPPTKALPAPTLPAPTLSARQLAQCLRAVRHPLLLLCATQAGFSALLVAAPFLLTSRGGLSVITVGMVLALQAGVGVLGFICIGALAHRVAEHRLIWCGLLVQALAALALWLLASLDHLALPPLIAAPPSAAALSAALLFASLAMAQLGFCLVVPVANAWAMDVDTGYRSAVAGTMLGMQALAGGLAACLAGLRYDGSAMSVAVVCTSAVIASMVTSILALRQMPRLSQPPA